MIDVPAERVRPELGEVAGLAGQELAAREHAREKERIGAVEHGEVDEGLPGWSSASTSRPCR